MGAARHILIHGRVLTADELIEKVESVGPADLQRLLERLIASPLSLATVGPILNVARFEAVAAKFAPASSRAA